MGTDRLDGGQVLDRHATTPAPALAPMRATRGGPRQLYHVTGGTWSAQMVLDLMCQWYTETGGAPRAHDWYPDAGRRMGLMGPERQKWEREWPRWPSPATVRTYLGSWRAALLAAGLSARQPPELPLAERVEAARMLARSGESAAAIADYLYVAPSTVRGYLTASTCRLCGGPKIDAFARSCGPCANRRRPKRATKSSILEAMAEWALEERAAPRSSDWRPPPAGEPPNKWEREWPRWPSTGQVTTLFGSWHKAMVAAGFVLRRDTSPWDDHAIRAAIVAWTREHGRPPQIRQWQRASPRHPAAGTVIERFGSWSAALRDAGQLSDAPSSLRMPTRGGWTEARVLAAMRRWRRAHGDWPTSEQWARAHPPEHPGQMTVRRFFGSWQAGLSAAGGPTRASQAWERGEIVSAIRSWAERTGAPPRARDWMTRASDGSRPTTHMVECAFGSWTRALAAAGYEPQEARWTREAVVEALCRFADENGAVPSYDAWERAGPAYPSHPTVRRHFSSWSAALDSAGLAARRNGTARTRERRERSLVP